MTIIHVQYMRKNYGGSESIIENFMKFSGLSHNVVFAEKTDPRGYTCDFEKMSGGFSDLIDKLDYKRGDLILAHFLVPAYLSQERGLSTLLFSHCMLSEEFSLAVNDFRNRDDKENMKKSYEKSRSEEADKYPRVRNIVTVSDFHLKEIESLGGRAKKMNCPIDLDFFAPKDTKECRRALGIPDRYTLLFNSRPTYLKGFHILLDAFRQMDGKDIQLMVTGDYSSVDGNVLYNPAVGNGNHIVSYNSGDNVMVLDNMPRERIPLVYGASDVTICPSLYEALGCVNLESQACERPVIASNIGGTSEAVRGEETGLLFTPGNSGSLRECVEFLYENRRLSENFGKAGRDNVKSYNARNIVPCFDEEFDRIIKSTT